MSKCEKEILLKEFGSWLDFVKQIDESIWDKPLGEGKWAVCDVVSHILLWDKYFYEEAIKPIVEEKPVTVEHLDFELFNQEAREFAKTKTNQELAKLAKEYRKCIINSIQEQPAEKFTRQNKDAQGNNFVIKNYLKDFIWHDQHHMKQIAEIGKKRKEKQDRFITFKGIIS